MSTVGITYNYVKASTYAQLSHRKLGDTNRLPKTRCAYVNPVRHAEYIKPLIYSILATLFSSHRLRVPLPPRAMPGSKDQSPKLLDQVRRVCQRRQYSDHTEKVYVRWVTRCVRVHNTTHPRRLDEYDIRALLHHLASDRNVAASTQNQALNALTERT